MVIIVIPARLESTRLPGKVLLAETGKTMLRHVYERAIKVRNADKVMIAAEKDEILEASFKDLPFLNIGSIVEKPDCKSGTDRVALAVKCYCDDDIIINLQADEPEIDPLHIEKLINTALADSDGKGLLHGPHIHTLGVNEPIAMKHYQKSVVKIAVGWGGIARYFSREVIPTDTDRVWRHVGVYAFRKAYLDRFTSLQRGILEEQENIEHLRAIEDGAEIKIVQVDHAETGIDTRNEYEAFVKRYKEVE